MAEAVDGARGALAETQSSSWRGISISIGIKKSKAAIEIATAKCLIAKTTARRHRRRAAASQHGVCEISK